MDIKITYSDMGKSQQAKWKRLSSSPMSYEALTANASQIYHQISLKVHSKVFLLVPIQLS